MELRELTQLVEQISRHIDNLRRTHSEYRRAAENLERSASEMDGEMRRRIDEFKRADQQTSGRDLDRTIRQMRDEYGRIIRQKREQASVIKRDMQQIERDIEDATRSLNNIKRHQTFLDRYSSQVRFDISRALSVVSR